MSIDLLKQKRWLASGSIPNRALNRKNGSPFFLAVSRRNRTARKPVGKFQAGLSKWGIASRIK